MALDAAPWWQRSVIYQIYPRSFADHGGDGVGDLPGIYSRLDYLAWLGVDAVWISPFFRSPMQDFGYDVSDYCDVDPLFGTLADFDALLEKAHALGIRVMIDWVPSHTSSEHPWFQAALADPEGPERDFYVFRDPAPDGGPPNGWLAAFPNGASAWTLDEHSGQYYLHSFLPEQPDLNWHNDALADRMWKTLRFWLDRGVDGFRADVVHNLAKDPELGELPDGLRQLPCMLFCDRPETHARLREMRALLDSYPGNRAVVGEVFLLDSDKVAGYYGNGDELHMCFDFVPLYLPWEATAWREQLQRSMATLEERGAWPTWVLGNHDQKRLRTRLGDSEARSRAACVLLLTLRGTPFVYMGEELGLLDAQVPEDQRVDPGGRDGCRAPLPWTAQPGHGWSGPTWLPVPPEAATRNVEALQADPGSILQLYRNMLALRRASPALKRGSFELLDAPDGVLAFERRAGDERCQVWINFTSEFVALPGAARNGIVLLDSDRAGQTRAGGPVEDDGCRGGLAPNQALVLRCPDS